MKRALCLLLLVMAANPAKAASPTRRSSIVLPIEADYRTSMTASALWREVSARIDADAWFYGPPVAGTVANDPQCQSADFGREFDAIVLGVINDLGKGRHGDVREKIALFQQRLRCLTPAGVRVLDSKLATYLDWSLQYLSANRKASAVRGTFNLGVLVTDEILYTGTALFMQTVNEKYEEIDRLMGGYPYAELGLFLHDQEKDMGAWLIEQPARDVVSLYRDSFNFGLGLCSQQEMLDEGGVCTRGACDPGQALKEYEPLRQRYRFGNAVEAIKEKLTEPANTNGGPLFALYQPQGGSPPANVDFVPGSAEKRNGHSSTCVPRNRGARDMKNGNTPGRRAQHCAMLHLSQTTGTGQLMCVSRALDLDPTFTLPPLFKNFLTPIDRSCAYTDGTTEDEEKKKKEEDDKKKKEDDKKEDDKKKEEKKEEKKKKDEAEAKKKADEAAKKNAEDLRIQAAEARRNGKEDLAKQLEAAAEKGAPAVVIEDDARCKGDSDACYRTDTKTIYIDKDCIESGKCKGADGRTHELEYAIRHEVSHGQFDAAGVPWAANRDHEIHDDANAYGGPSGYWNTRTPNPSDDNASACGTRGTNAAKRIAALNRCNPNHVEMSPWSKPALVTDPGPETTDGRATGIATCFDPSLMNQIQAQIGASLSICAKMLCPSDAPCTCTGDSISPARRLPGYNGPSGAIDPMPDEVRPGRCFLPGCR